MRAHHVSAPVAGRAALLLSLLSGLLLLSASPGTEKREVNGCRVPQPTTPHAPALDADFVVVASPSFQYVVNGLVNGAITLTRGHSYLFDLTAFGDEHPFVINSNATNPWGTIYLPGSYGSVVGFTPTAAMPGTIFYHCEVHYGGMVGTIHLEDPPVCMGDLNADGQVNSFDFGIFVAAFGSTCASCASDLNSDGVVNSFDHAVFVNAFGAGCG